MYISYYYRDVYLWLAKVLGRVHSLLHVGKVPFVQVVGLETDLVTCGVPGETGARTSFGSSSSPYCIV